LIWIVVGAGKVLVRLKVAGVTPTAEAVTLKLPAMPLAVKGLVATPEALVVTVKPLAKVPEAPLGGAVKVMLAPGKGLLNANSVSCTCSGVAKAVFIAVLWGVPVAVKLNPADS